MPRNGCVEKGVEFPGPQRMTPHDLELICGDLPPTMVDPAAVIAYRILMTRIQSTPMGREPVGRTGWAVRMISPRPAFLICGSTTDLLATIHEFEQIMRLVRTCRLRSAHRNKSSRLWESCRLATPRLPAKAKFACEACPRPS